jgi:large subunit ribosomal protein L4
MKQTVYSQDGSTADSITLPESVFGHSFNADLVHEVVVAMQGNARAGTAHTKDRGEVSGTGKKPWRQKGTGRARHGSQRSPIWTGGGVTFGPRNEKNFSRKINKKVKAKALANVLSRKLSDQEIVFVDKLSFAEPKTREAKEFIATLARATERPDLATKPTNAVLLILPERDETTEKSFQNFNNLAVMQAKDVNSLDLLTYKYVVVSDAPAVVEALTSRVTKTT